MSLYLLEEGCGCNSELDLRSAKLTHEPSEPRQPTPLHPISNPPPTTTTTLTMASSNLPLEIASTLQSASINRSPSPSHDLNPSTTSSQKQPVSLQQPQPPSTSSLENEPYDEIDDDEEDIPYSVLKPIPRRQSFPPLPDLRFEQSYLASIAGAETWGRVVYITVRDQVYLLLPNS
jgi:hypothetical protein